MTFEGSSSSLSRFALVFPFAEGSLELDEDAVILFDFGSVLRPLGAADDEAAALSDVVEACLERVFKVPPTFVAVTGALIEAEGGLMERDDCASLDGGLVGSAFFSASALIFRFFVVSSSVYTPHRQ